MHSTYSHPPTPPLSPPLSPPPLPGWTYAFQHPVKGTGKCSVDCCNSPPAPPHAPPTLPHHLFFFSSGSISANSRCLAKPEDTSDTEREVLGTSFTLCSHSCHSSYSGQSWMKHLIISCSSVCVCEFLFSVDGKEI